VIGDGPARAMLEARAVGLGVNERIHWLGYVADRSTYMDALASCDLFVFPSPAEGFPKVILDAMAAGLPVVATPSGELASIGSRRMEPLVSTGPMPLAESVGSLLRSPNRATNLRAMGSAFAMGHTRPFEAARLAEWIDRLASGRIK
jgi:glycogen synthase